MLQCSHSFRFITTDMLPQGWCHSVTAFQRIMGKVRYQQILREVPIFLDDAGTKGPRSRYNDEDMSPGIRRFVYEHAQIFSKVLTRRMDCWIDNLRIRVRDWNVRN
jgi:hypothetical protein